MDRRSWLWRRKSSEKSPTESSGSVSSQHSERFSDDQTLSNHNIQSPEVTSKAAPDEEPNDSVKTLSEKLTEALLNIREKEDLVKQHAKVAEEAVSGWERAENEVAVLKKQNEALTQKNLILEERVGHLDGALKECLRQLRQAREEQEEKTYEWESLRSQLENAKTNVNTVSAKLEAAEKDKSILKLELLSKAKELELRSRERDLSTHAAETASKQHLDSIKRVAKLEAECRRLKAWARKASSSVFLESSTDSQSDNAEREHIIEDDSGKMTDSQGRSNSSSLMVPSVEIDDLMDDFLEMERLAALPEDNSPGAKVHSKETRLSNELEAMINKTIELEDTLNKITAEKASLEIALNESEIQLKASQEQLTHTEMKLIDLKTQLAVANDAQKEVECTKVELNNLTKLLGEAEANRTKIQDQLARANQAKSMVEVQLEDALIKKAESESQLKVMELEFETLHSSITTLEKEYEKEKNISRETVAKCRILEAEISRMKSDVQFQRSAIIEEFRLSQDKELAVAAGKFAECQKTIASLGRQLKSLATLEDLLIYSERP